MSKTGTTEFEYQDGVRILADQSSHEEPEANEKLENIINDAKAIGCVAALEKHNHHLTYLTDAKRMSYLDAVGISDTDDVLEIGSSLGQHTRIIAQRSKSVSAIEVVPLQAAFSRIWCDEEGLENVDISTGGASGQLPYDDASFDVVFCNYVLEWCAGRTEMDPADFHRKYIGEINRVLKPGGRLYLSTKNRLSLKYILGSRDEHLGVRFGSLLPRGYQKRIRDKARLGRTTGYLHSWDGLEAILKDAGFDDNRRILAFPDARFPEYLGDFDGFSADKLPQGVTDSLARKDKLSLRLPARAFELTTNSLVFLSKKAPKDAAGS